MNPWEKYGGPAAGPWSKYAKPESQVSRELSATQSPAVPSVASDVVQSLGSGLRSGVESLAGMAGDVNAMGGRAASWLAEKLGAGPETAANVGSVVSHASPLTYGMPTSERYRQETDAAIGDTLKHEPATTAGEYAHTVGEFLPAAVTGPGGVVRKTAMATIPAVFSETAGQVTEGTPFEPWARGGAALGAGMLTAGVRNPVSAVAKGAPTREALKGKTDALYQGLRDAGIKYDANEYAATVQRATDELLKKGYRQNSFREAFAFIDDMAAGVGRSPDFDDINGMVMRSGELARDAAAGGKKGLAGAFGIIRDHLDDFERNAPLMTSQPIPQATLNSARSVARRAALQNIKQRAIDEVVKDADAYAAGLDAGIRQGLRNLLKSKRGKQLFKGAERDALLDVANGRKALQTLSKFGFDLTKTGGNAAFLPTLSTGGALYAAGPLPAAALATAGTIAKQVSPALTQRAVEQAMAAIRSGQLMGPLGQRVSQQLIDRNVRRFLAAQNAAVAAGSE